MKLKNADELLEKTECLFKDLNSTEDYMGIGYNHGVGDSIAIIKNAPTIEAEPVKHGRWSHHYDDELVSGTCTVCGWQSMIMETDVADMPYCPNCGARMDLEEGESHDQN